jgi:hypothetical protein
MFADSRQTNLQWPASSVVTRVMTHAFRLKPRVQHLVREIVQVPEGGL